MIEIKLTDDAAQKIVREGELFRKKTVVRLGKLPFDVVTTNRENETNHGKKGDYLAEDGHGGYYVISAEFHQKNYERADD